MSGPRGRVGDAKVHTLLPDAECGLTAPHMLGKLVKWTLMRGPMNFKSTTIDGVIDSYGEYLRLKHSANFEGFELRRASDREAALAEAVVFGLLKSLHLSPELNEEVGTGGVDFICAGSTLSYGLRKVIKPSLEDRFVVEATSLDPDAVSRRSGIPNELPDDVSGGPFLLLTRSLFNKAKDKTTQLGGYLMPRVLAIVSSHAQISALFNNAGAEFALISDPHIVTQMGSQETGGQSTDLRSSVFLKIDPHRNAVVPCRQTISAILLIAIYGDHSEIFGILHPEPARPLKMAFFPKVPFVRVSNWPIKGEVISCEWVITDPNGLSIPHWPVSVGD